jgi:undecaprenyl-diphosphatase
MKAPSHDAPAGPQAAPSEPARTVTAVVTLGFLFAVVAATLLAWLTKEVLKGDTARFDAYVRSGVHAQASSPLTAVMWFFTDLGSVLVLSCLLLAAVVIFYCYRWRRAAVLLAVTMAGACILEPALKTGFHRARPLPYFGITAPASFSYPSGHSLFSFAFFATLAALAANRISRRWMRALIWSVAVVIIGGIGLSRIYLGVHYPTDVLAGYLTGFIWVAAVSFGDRMYPRLRRRLAINRRPVGRDLDRMRVVERDEGVE